MTGPAEVRQTGRTTRQMQDAPTGAVFIWCNSDLHYPRHLARSLGREDLVISSPWWLETRNWRGKTLSGIVLDHETEVRLSTHQWCCYEDARTRIHVGPNTDQEL